MVNYLFVRMELHLEHLEQKFHGGKHSAYIEGSLQVGNPEIFNSSLKRIATVMIGKDGNAGAIRALFVKKGDVTIIGDTDQNRRH